MSTSINETVVLGLTLKLLLSLGEFGLNPSEWQLATSAEINQLVLIHYADPDFRLIGKIKNGKWSSLEVLSI